MSSDTCPPSLPAIARGRAPITGTAEATAIPHLLTTEWPFEEEIVLVDREVAAQIPYAGLSRKDD